MNILGELQSAYVNQYVHPYESLLHGLVEGGKAPNARQSQDLVRFGVGLGKTPEDIQADVEKLIKDKEPKPGADAKKASKKSTSKDKAS